MEAKCQKCSATVYVSDKFCRSCGSLLKEQRGDQVSVETGKGSTNIGVGNLPGASIHVGDKYEGSEPKIAPHLKRETVRQVKIGNTAVNTSVLITLGYLSLLVGAFGFFISIRNLLYGTFHSHAYISYIVFTMYFLLIFGILGISLKRHRFIRINKLRLNIESDSTGHIYITKIGGTCPKCKSDLVLSETGDTDNNTTLVMCTRNPMQHRWEFDPTQLSDLALENKT